MEQKDSILPGRGTTILTVILLTILLGVVIGAVNAYVGLKPGIWFVIFFPHVVLIFRLLLRRRPVYQSSGAETVILEARNTGRRIVQTVIPLAGTLLGIAGVAMLFRADGGRSALSVSLTVAAIVLVAVSLRSVIAWDVAYKGHTIRFENDPCRGERLFIDGQIADRGGVGIDMHLSGTITSGDGAGETIVVRSHAGLPTLFVRIAAASPART